MKQRVMKLQSLSDSYDEARRGAWNEFVGDFRLIGGLDHVEEAYKKAADIYTEAGDPRVGLNEQEHLKLVEFFEGVALAAGEDLDVWYEAKNSATLTNWLERKENYMPEYLEKIEEKGQWPG